MKNFFITLIIFWGAIFSFNSLFADEPQDFTNLLINSDFEYVSEGVLNTGVTRGIPYGWSVTGELQLDAYGNQSYGVQTNDATNFNGNSLCWINSVPMPEEFELYQEVEGLPAGEYSVYCRFAVTDGFMTNQRLFANNNVQYFGSQSDYDQNISSGENNTFANYIPINSFELKEMLVKVDIAEGETLKLGIRSSNLLSDGTRVTDNNAGWFKVDYFRLEPYTEVTGLLSDLILNGESIAEFDPVNDYYEIEVPYGTTSLSFEPVVAEIGSTVSITGSSTAVYDYDTKMLTWDENGDFITIKVTSPEGLEMEYGVDIFVADGTSDSYLKNIELSAGVLDTLFNHLTKEYTVVVPIGTESVEVVAVPNFPDASVEGDGIFEIAEEDIEVNITVKSFDGSGENTYKVTIIEAESFTSLLTNPDFEYSSKGVLNNGSTFRGIPYGWSFEGELIGESFGINNDGSDFNGNNLCWINSSPMPDEFELFQVVENIPEGEYKVQCLLVVMDQRVTNQRLFANNSVQYFGSEANYVSNLTADEENTFAGWEPSTTYSLKEMEVNVVITEGESLRLGIRSGNFLSDGNREISNNAGWFKVDHFRLEQISTTNNIDEFAENRNVLILNTSEGFEVKIDEMFSHGEIVVYSMNGNLLLHQTISSLNTKVNITNSGIYVVKALVDGNLTIQKVLIY